MCGCIYVNEYVYVCVSVCARMLYMFIYEFSYFLSRAHRLVMNSIHSSSYSPYIDYMYIFPIVLFCHHVFIHVSPYLPLILLQLSTVPIIMRNHIILYRSMICKYSKQFVLFHIVWNYLTCKYILNIPMISND